MEFYDSHEELTSAKRMKLHADSLIRCLLKSSLILGTRAEKIWGFKELPVLCKPKINRTAHMSIRHVIKESRCF
jgi:hypothetical protein